MEVKKITNAQPFQAKLRLSAPESLLSAKERQILTKIGTRIGKPTDTITITLSNLIESKMSPGAKSYTCTSKYRIGNRIQDTKVSVLYCMPNGSLVEKNKPMNYIKRQLLSWIGK